MDIYKRLIELIKKNKTNRATVLRELGFNSSAFNDWRIGKKGPNLESLIKFSDYFGVSLDYLARGTEWNNNQNSSSISGSIMDHNTKQMIELFEQLPLNSKLKVIGYTEALLETTKEFNSEKRLSV